MTVVIITFIAALLIRGTTDVTDSSNSPSVPAPALPDGFFSESVVSGLDLPVAIDWAADGRMFIAEKAGVVKVFQDGALLPTPFIDISDKVNSSHDRGLLGIAIHPEFPNIPYVYLLFTYDPPELKGMTGRAAPDRGGNRVARLIRVTADAGKGYKTATHKSEQVLLGKNSTFQNIGDPAGNHLSRPSCEDNGMPIEDCLPIDEKTHTIGTVIFSIDGSLFVSNGDGSCQGMACPYNLRAQDLDSLAGKILRIHPLTGDGYPDNPFFDGDFRSNRSKVYSYGLRNPFRFAISPFTNEPYIGDVGWATWEEVNTGRGANFGWPCYEGGNGVSIKQEDYVHYQVCKDLSEGAVTPAIYSWYRAGTGGAAVGGAFYTGNIYPDEYRGAFFFGDYVHGWIRYMSPDGKVHDFGSRVYGFVQLKVGPDSNLYYVNIATGQIMRFRYVGNGNVPPTAVAKAKPSSGLTPLIVSFSGDASFDPDGNQLTYNWSFGDGSTGDSANPTHVYTAEGTYTAVLTVSDTTKLSHSNGITISVGNRAPVARITTPANNSVYNVREVINFKGSGTDPEDGELKGDSLKWEVIIHHNTHLHYDYFHGTGNSGSFISLDHEDDSYLELCLTVTDSGGLQDKDCVDVLPRKVAYTFNTVPPGLVLSYSGRTYTTPFTVNASVGGRRSISAVEAQSGYSFLSWSDGGDPNHTIIIQDRPQSLAASYSFNNMEK